MTQLFPCLAQQKAAALPKEDVAGEWVDEAGCNQRVFNICRHRQIVVLESFGTRFPRGRLTERGRMDQGAKHLDMWTLGAEQLRQLPHEAEVGLVGDAHEARLAAQVVPEHRGRHLCFPLVGERQDPQHRAGHLVEHLAVDVLGLVGAPEERHGGGGVVVVVVVAAERSVRRASGDEKLLRESKRAAPERESAGEGEDVTGRRWFAVVVKRSQISRCKRRVWTVRLLLKMAATILRQSASMPGIRACKLATQSCNKGVSVVILHYPKFLARMRPKRQLSSQ
ncbi:hypothetical protein IWX90DRAFT_437377 [Phyllosticta citrichinensis]|uniref:Uncharacterized protein n=1 Tax=Phyllosticta citrichinensis TaxID=1130410 RepID=A0ABR1XM49_9PEZI